MRVFIVHAHHEPASFNGAMTREASTALVAAGHEVIVSDLHAMGFDPVSDRRNFTTVNDAVRLRQQSEESYAAAHDGFAPDLQREMDKLFWCDVLIFQFPLWWFGVPAILKGWIDRVFAVGRTYGGGKFYDRGVFVGKRAMCALTVGGPSPVYSDPAMAAPISAILFPIHRGIFYFTGFTVIEPFVVHAPASLGNEEREAALQRYRERVLGLADAPIIDYPKLADIQAKALKV